MRLEAGINPIALELAEEATQPRVSIIVPAFNEPVAVLHESLESLRAQTFSDFECLLVDESTQPDLAAACRNFCARDIRFRYLHPEGRLGLAGSLNYGITRAKGEFIARFDSDDICAPDRLALQVDYLNTHPDVDILGGALEIIGEDGSPTAARYYPEDHAAIRRLFHFTTPIAHPTVMIRKEVISRAGGYNTNFRCAEDLELWLRLLEGGIHFANLQKVLVRYRQSVTSRSSRHWRFNLRARMKYLGLRSLPFQVAGLAMIAVWAALPKFVQVRIYKDMLLREKGK